MQFARHLVVAAALAAVLPSCSSSVPAAPEERRVVSIDVRPHHNRLALLAAGGPRGVRQLVANPHDTRGRPVQRPVTWSSDSGAVRVDAAGRVSLSGLSGPGLVWARSAGVAGAAAVCPLIYENDFEDDAPGPFTRQALDAGWNSPTGVSGLDRASIVTGAGARGGKSLKVVFPRGGVGPAQGGALWVMPLGGSYQELYASYDVRFGPGFDFALGGKLPGLAGGQQNTGGNRPHGRDGWSARGMWLAGGRLIQYVYHPDQAGNFGDGMAWTQDGRDVYALPDRWYHVEHRVVMNTPGWRDGIVQAWLDGVLVMDRRGVRFRDVPSFAIEAFHFTTFFGGNEPGFAARRDEAVYFDNVVISTFRIGPSSAVAVPECQPDGE
jgi:hypothetical protein